MCEQISMLYVKGAFTDEQLEEMERQANVLFDYAKKKRNWENAFQRWSDEQGIDGAMSTGCCGFGSMCDWCEDNSYGRPCIRALNAMCREKNISIDYDDRDFEKVWYGK